MAKKHWNDHLSNFSLEDSGDYNYRGAFFAINGTKDETPNEIVNLILPIWILGILSLLSVGIAGMFPATGATDTWYVILPFGITIAMACVILYHLAKLTKALLSREASSVHNLRPVQNETIGESENGEAIGGEGEEFVFGSNPIYDKDGKGLVREYIYEKTWPRLMPMTKVMLATAVITVVTEIMHLAINGKGNHFGGALLLIILVLVNAMCGGLLLYRYNTVKWLKIAKN